MQAGGRAAAGYRVDSGVGQADDSPFYIGAAGSPLVVADGRSAGLAGPPADYAQYHRVELQTAGGARAKAIQTPWSVRRWLVIASGRGGVQRGGRHLHRVGSPSSDRGFGYAEVVGGQEPDAKGDAKQ